MEVKATWDTDSKRPDCTEMAAKIAIEPVFEADFRECSYGFRPKRSAKQALEVVRKACNNKGYYVRACNNKGYYVVDIEKFFDNVNQDKLMILDRTAHIRPKNTEADKTVDEVWDHSLGNILRADLWKYTDFRLGTSQGQSFHHYWQIYI